MIGNVIQCQYLVVTDYPAAAALSFVLMAIILALVSSTSASPAPRRSWARRPSERRA